MKESVELTVHGRGDPPMPVRVPLLRDHWYVACPSTRLRDDEPLGFEVGDQHYVAFRDTTGMPRILQDRCCHRGVPLSLGRVHDGVIACGYHGWQYSGDGALVNVPSLGDRSAPPRYCVPSAHATEVHHYVWVWIPGEHAEPTYQPSLIGVEDHGWLQQTAIWQVPVGAAVENQLDFAHTGFAHPGIYPGHRTPPGVRPPLRSFDIEARIVDRAVVTFGPPVDAGAAIPSSVELDFWARFDLPYRNYVFLEAERAYAIYNWVPLSASSCRLEFLGAQDTPDGAALLPRGGALFDGNELELLRQDRVLLEGAHRRNATGIAERSVITDTPQLMARHLIQSELNGRTDPAGTAEERRRIFTCTA